MIRGGGPAGGAFEGGTAVGFGTAVLFAEDGLGREAEEAEADAAEAVGDGLAGAGGLPGGHTLDLV